MLTDEQRHFAELFARCQNRIYAFVLSIEPSPAAAEEIFQETVVVLWEKWAEFDAARDFAPWACGIARNVALRFWEKRQRRFAPLSSAAVDVVCEEFEAAESLHAARLTAMEECLQALPAKQRALLEDRYARRETIRQVAQRTGQSANALYQKLRRLRRALQECIDRKVARGDFT
jgi:RNA polymerase sigma-70 factor (ECF subfamily)